MIIVLQSNCNAVPFYSLTGLKYNYPKCDVTEDDPIKKSRFIELANSITAKNED